MPNATITVYLNGDDYQIYWKNREKINTNARELVKSIVGELKK